LEIVSQWAKINGLGLNPKKSKCIVVGKRVMATDALQKLSINNAPVEYVKTAINLGFTFNQTLTWDDHINKASRTGYTRAQIKGITFYSCYIAPSVHISEFRSNNAGDR